jgi:hypothetical protein
MHKRTVITFIMGILLGILGTLFLPNYVRPYLPESLSGKETVVTGTVLAKQKEKQALLVTVNTPQGALLATFMRKASEVDLLVNEKDQIEFTLQKYTPFIEDPKIIRVVKTPSSVPAKAPATPAKTSGKGAQEAKPEQPEKTPDVIPAPTTGSRNMKGVPE